MTRQLFVWDTNDRLGRSHIGDIDHHSRAIGHSRQSSSPRCVRSRCPRASRRSACRSPLGIQWSLQHPLTNAGEVTSRRGLIQRSVAKQGHPIRGDSHADLARCGDRSHLPSPKILDFVSRAVTAKPDRRCRCRDGLVRST